MTVAHADDPVNEFVSGDKGVVGGNHHCFAFTVQFGEDLQEFCGKEAVQMSSGLIGNNDLRLVDQGSGNCDSLLFSPDKEETFMCAFLRMLSLVRISFARLFISVMDVPLG